MSKELYVTIIEKDNAECPNAGTIHSLFGDDEELKAKLILALESHFDAEIERVDIQDDLKISDVRNSTPLDAVVTIGEEKYNIELQETWLY